MLRLSFLILLMVGVSCSKNKSGCEDRRNALEANDKLMVQSFIDFHISRLPSNVYNENNVSQLAASIGNECGFLVAVQCFDCIQTLPSQTELRISFNAGGNIMQRTVDLSYSPTNRIIFKDVHN